MTVTIRDSILNLPAPPVFSLILGSGLRLPGMEPIVESSFEDAGFKPRNAIDGHDYTISLYKVHGKNILVFNGRLHLYEGYSQTETTFPVRFSHETGIKKILLTSACGGITDDLATGDIVQVIDHINLTGSNPIIEISNNDRRSLFQEMSMVYRNGFSDTVERAIADCGFPPKKGVIVAVPGPIYETAAEIKYMKTIGANMVSMSFVPEAIYAHYLGMQVAGLSVIANHHSHIEDKPNHSTILQNIQEVNEKFGMIVGQVIRSN